MFKVNNIDTRTTPMPYFTPWSGVSIINFEQKNASWVTTNETEPNFYHQMLNAGITWFSVSLSKT